MGGMLPSTQDVLGSMPSPEQTGWGAWWCKIPGLERQRKEDQTFRVTSTTELILTTPRDRKLWGFVVAFMSRIKSRVYFTKTKQLEKSKPLFKGSHSCFLCQLSPLILYPVAQILWEGRRRLLHFLFGLAPLKSFTCSVYLQACASQPV